MKLIKGFKTKDLRNFEKVNGSILDMFDVTTDNLVRLVQLGNGMCSEDEACDLIDEYMQEGENDYISGLMEIFRGLQLMGKLPKKVSLNQLEAKLHKEMENMTL